jgi:O-antigen/teichoic acid export membrane protein
MIFRLVTLETVLLAMWVGVALTAMARLWLAKGELFQRPRLAPFLKLLSVGGRFHGAAVLALAVAQVDRLFVISLFDTARVGYYVAAVAYASTGFHVLNGAFGTLLFPEIASQAGAVGQRDALIRTLRQASSVSIALSIPLAFLAPWLLPLLFGAAFVPAVPLAQGLVVVAALQAFREVIAVGCAGIQMWRPPIVAEALTLAVMIALASPMAGTFGLLGIVIAAGASNAMGLGYLLVIAGSRFGLRPADWWGAAAVNPETHPR